MEFLYIVILPLFGILALWGVGTIAYGYFESKHDQLIPSYSAYPKNDNSDDSDLVNTFENPFIKNPIWDDLPENDWHNPAHDYQ